MFYFVSLTDLVKNFTTAEPQPNPHNQNAPPIYLIQGKVGREDFKNFLLKRGGEAKVSLTETNLPDGRLARVTKAGFSAAVDQFMERLYHQQSQMTLEDIVNVKRQLRQEINEFEVSFFL